MKLIVQTVSQAKVENEFNQISKINKGLIIYMGLSNDFNEKKLDKAVNKILKLKAFKDEVNFKKSVVDVQGEILVISNFTLFGTAKKSKPDFSNSLKFDEAKKYYELFLRKLEEKYDSKKVKSGFFGEYMKITSVIEGPITLILDF